MVLFPALAWVTAALNSEVTGVDGEQVHEPGVTWVPLEVVAFQVPKWALAVEAEGAEGAAGQYDHDHDRVPHPWVSRSGSRVLLLPYWVNAELSAATS